MLLIPDPATATIAVGSAVLQAGGTTSTSQIATVSGAVLLALAWIVCVILVGTGVAAKKTLLLNLGIVAGGIMTIVTPLVYYVSEVVRLGMFEASIQDFLLLAGLSALGGGIISYGMLRLGRASTRQGPSETR